MVFLPPYCWFLNPIEEAFGMVKQWVQRNYDYCRELGSTARIFDEAFKSVSAEGARACFRSCRYL